MNYRVSFEKNSGKKSEHLSKNLTIAGFGKNDKGLASLKKGQQITGTVISAGKEVTLDFYGQKVIASKNVLHNAIPGETKTFEVVKANDKEIELKLLEGIVGKPHTFTAAVVNDTDWGTIMSKKDEAAKKAGKEAGYKDQADKLEEIRAKLTERDYKHLEDEGFKIENFSIDGLYEAIGRMKSGAFLDEQTSSKVAAGKMGSFDRTAIAERLKEENLPATEENLAKIQKALSLSDTAVKLDDKAMQYLISRKATPTIENIYKANYSGTIQNQPLSDQAWSELEGQAAGVIKAAGYEVNEENLAAARWLIESKLPLTEDTFTYKKELEEIGDGFDKAAVFNSILEGMRMGMNPNDVSLLPQGKTTAEQLIADIHSIRPETVTEAVKAGTELTIRNLKAIQESRFNDRNTREPGKEAVSSDVAATQDIEGEAEEAQEGSSAANNSTANNSEGNSTGTDIRYEEIKAQRQLEEIRLKMTLEAAAVLEKKGFKLETQELSKVVEALKELEDSYYMKYFKEADAKVSEESLQLLKETTLSIGQLKYIPSLVLGSTLADRATQTIPGLLSEGQKLKAELDKAGTAYETLMTVPSKEYGDSIKKAFSNMDSLLSEMKIENTEQNQRAVRALGYNRMEINEESINLVKAYDLQVSSLIKNLHPAVAVRMIKEGLNPLKLPINELNHTIDRIKEEQGITSEDKYSTYLQKLEKGNGITDQERKAYIGIYRLLYNVEKSDGAALGAVIKAGQDVTLGNLLTAVQTGKKGRLEAIINDEFGTLQSISRDKESIAEQLSSFSGNAGQQNREQTAKEDGTAKQAAKEDDTAEQSGYLNRILKQMKDEISPEGLKLFSSQSGTWETIKNIPVEKLYEQMKADTPEKPAQEGDYSAKVQEIRDLCKNAEQSIRFLNDYQVPSTPMNILIANHILSNGESPIKKLLKLQKENIVDKSENSLKELTDLSDKLIDKQSMEEVYSQLESEAQEALKKACSEEKIDSFKLAELKNMGQQLTFVRTLAEKENYQIPVETDRGITNMNLTFIRGAKESGTLSVTIWSEKLGNVKAEFSLKGKALKGFIGSDNRAGLEELQKNTGELEAAASESSVTLKQMDFGTLRRESDTYSYQNPDLGEDASSRNQNTERTLYRLAKAIVKAVRTAENSGSESDLAVSQK